MPESNGKTNWTAILHSKGADAMLDGFCFARSEYPDRVRYEADRMRWVVGELSERPSILDYDAASHSGYAAPAPQAREITVEEVARVPEVKALIEARRMQVACTEAYNAKREFVASRRAEGDWPHGITAEYEAMNGAARNFLSAAQSLGDAALRALADMQKEPTHDRP